MKPGACLISTSRSDMDRDALLAALRSGQLGGPGLDTPYEEPVAPTTRCSHSPM